MAEPLDLAKLLKIISTDKPAGLDLRENGSVYREVKIAWERARKAERKLLEPQDPNARAEDKPESPDPYWEKVLKLTPEVLATKSKDLDLAAWLTEALVRKRNFDGLLDGLKLIRRLVENFWDKGLHPSAEKYGLEESLYLVAALNGTPDAEGTLIRPLNRVPLTQQVGQAGPFCLADYQQELATGKPNLKNFEDTVAASAPAFVKQTRATIVQCLAEWEALDALLEKSCRGAAPFNEGAIPDPKALVLALKEADNDAARFVWSQFAEPARQSLAQSEDEDTLRKTLAAELNRVASGPSIYEEKRFGSVTLSEAARQFLAEKPAGHAQVRLNRLLLQETCSLEAPPSPFSATLTRDALSKCRDLLGSDPEQTPPPNPNQPTLGSPPPGPLQSREQAFKQLLEIARYFEKAEPHSPISHALKRIVRWGDLKLPQLLTELIRDQSARDAVFKLVGIDEKEKEKGEK